MTPATHIPVLLSECLELLQPREGGVYCDATVGLGGHAEAILEASSPTGRLVGIDRDPAALALARERLARFGDRVTLLHGELRDIVEILSELGLVAAEDGEQGGVDGLLVDLGVSSVQLDDPQRGFSFQRCGPLDMRMDPSGGITAAQYLAEVSEVELTRVLRVYGEQPRARAVASAIKRYLADESTADTAGLARIVAAVLPRRQAGAVHPATRTFMAIRIALNDELGQLARFLDEFLRVLAPGARLAVITFHSLEDRQVKRRFADLCRAGADLPADLPLTEAERGRALCESLTRRPVRSSDAETARNPRARSAKLRGLRFGGNSPRAEAA
ncbi:MAG: 16S rRNA (cytosine(1402)-N(4))-methyltransferase RsmH [bacterium]